MAAVRAFHVMLTALVVAAVAAAHAGTYQVLYTFHGFPARDGANPHAAPIMDRKGDLYGTTEAGGASACGTVYKLHKTRSGMWKEIILYSFQCGDDGYGPVGGVVMDQAGNLYGGTQLGGTGECFFNGARVGCGAVYKLTQGQRGAWSESTLYSWPAPSFDYAGPVASLTLDPDGTLFGTTLSDNPCKDNWGSVFRIKPVNGHWNEREVHDFCRAGHDGRFPGYGPLVFDPAGNLYGTTIGGGSGEDYGVVFRLNPLGQERWQFTKLYQFTQEEGGDLEGGLTLDAAGNLYGAALDSQYGSGEIFELSPAKNGKWHRQILNVFGGDNGVGPWQPPVFDSNGNLFGTTQQGGRAQYCINCGVIYELVPQGGGKWSESVVYSFGSQANVTDGANPIGGLTRGDDGNFYGTTYESGDPSCGGCGVVFEFAP